MKAKYKAKKLVDKFINYVDCNFIDSNSGFNNAKQCALIAVDEILAIVYLEHQEEYWEQVKIEIEKL